MNRSKTYEDFFDTAVPWLGKIPSHWELLPSRSVVQNVNERNEGAVNQNYLSLMSNVGVIKYEEKGDVGNKKPDDLTKCKLVKKGNLVINSMNYSIGSYGMSNYDGVCSPVYIVLDVNEERFERRFALRIFENKPFQKFLSTFGNGILAHRAAISWDDIKGKYLPVPPKNEQEKILRFLDFEVERINSLIKKQQRLIELLKEKRQSVISHSVTKGLNPEAPMKDSGVKWLGEVPEHWDVVKLSYRYEVLLGKMLDDKKITGDFLGRYLRNTDVQWDRINDSDLPQMDFRKSEYERYSVSKGDLLVCEGGEIGRSAIWSKDEKCFYQKALHRLRPHDAISENTRYMFYLFYDSVCKERFVAGAEKATIAHLPAERLRQYRFPFPPVDEQDQIVKYLDIQKKKFDMVEKHALKQIRLLREKRKGLISAAVTGKIDLRKWNQK